MQTFASEMIALPLPPRGDRPVQLKSDSHFSGHLIFHRKCRAQSGASRGQVLEVESHLEMNIALILAMRPQVVDLECQVRFNWRSPEAAKWSKHFFDFRVTLIDGSRVAVMVKRSKKLSCPKFCEIRDAIVAEIKEECADRAIVLTERDINPIELHNASFLNSLTDADPEADAAASRAMHGVQGGRSIGEVVNDIGMAGRGFRAVGRMLRQGELELTNMERITTQAIVRRPAL